ncbi:MAG TPA: CPBP family intramembrane glutamic endopeptidase [Amnibacterium sp.]|nr:CPBP family intramembrane glutamic endopeptidase [Amnibacterium sp.]
MTALPTPAEPRTLGERIRSRPIGSALTLEVLAIAITVGGAAVLAALLPDLPGYSVTAPSQSLVLVILLAALVLALVAGLRWWRSTGFTRPSEWRDLRLYWLPVVLLFAPFVAGIRIPSLAVVGMLLLGYLATAVFEETMWRGVMLAVLRPLGIWPAVLLSSVLFGLGHLGNSSLRGFSVMIVAQAFGAAVQGVGLAAVRLRTNTIWPLIAIHALHDLFLQMGRLPVALIEVPIDTIFLIYGIVLLRRTRREQLELSPTIPAARSGVAAGR